MRARARVCACLYVKLPPRRETEREKQQRNEEAVTFGSRGCCCVSEGGWRGFAAVVCWLS